MSKRINDIARRLAAYHAASPEVIAAGGCSESDAAEFPRSTLVAALREEWPGLKGDDLERDLDELRETLRYRLIDLAGISAVKARALVDRIASGH